MIKTKWVRAEIVIDHDYDGEGFDAVIDTIPGSDTDVYESADTLTSEATVSEELSQMGFSLPNDWGLGRDQVPDREGRYETKVRVHYEAFLDCLATGSTCLYVRPTNEWHRTGDKP